MKLENCKFYIIRFYKGTKLNELKHRIMDGRKRSYYILEKTEIKSTKWDTPKKDLKNKIV